MTIKNHAGITDDLPLLLDVLPPHLRKQVMKHPQMGQLLEIILDLGREPEARFPGSYTVLSDKPVTEEDIALVVGQIGDFGDDNRAGIPRTLHRISAIRNRQGVIIGLTCRVGRAVPGTVDIIRDVMEMGKSILILGRPGVGKTTKLREMTRVLADTNGKRVVVVDTSNEIGGDGDIPHPAIGRARRMQVPHVVAQHAVMIEAVENHMPEVIVIDEIGNEAEAMAARTIAERGVQLIATAHGNSLENLMQNPSLNDLIGGITSVTLSDEEARRRGTQKTVLERKAPPTFDVVIEMIEQDKLAVYDEIAIVIDHALREGLPTPEIRSIGSDGQVEKRPGVDLTVREEDGGKWREYGGFLEDKPVTIPQDKAIYIYPHGVARNKLERAIAEMGVNAVMARHMEDADIILAVKQLERRDSAKLEQIERAGVPVYVIRSNTYQQIANALHEITSPNQDGEEMQAVREARTAIREVLATSRPVELPPREAYLRRLQHRLANQHQLHSESIGNEPYRRVRIGK
ncbi:MAG: R3H domain-containing nucleic acid-binding protein [bacterium]